ncbi:MAG: glutamate-cysteine ligase family protein [Fibrobacteraceae bacterium]|nr:glutamate-cysteine ligase family protein [Fibrobacteraceae bacterium]
MTEKKPSWHLFERFGIELEYMIVSKATRNVVPRVDIVLGKDENGENLSEIEHGPVGLSNELVSHVLEIKCAEPAESFDGWSDLFHQEIESANEKLAKIEAELLPSAAHPFMDPLTETKLWPYEYNEIYETYNRIFNCRGHGWANLQSTHLNLSFNGDEEFGILHAAVRLLLPLIPALAASSPYLDSKYTGYKDARIETYRHNQEKISSIAGDIIPEPVFTESDYNKVIFDRIEKDIAPYDTKKLLNHFFLNSRGAIARFDRGAIEIRLVDIQECPAADIAIAEFEIALLRFLTTKCGATLAEQKSFTTDELKKILFATVKDAENAEISSKKYLAAFGYAKNSASAKDLLQYLFSRVRPQMTKTSATLLEKMLDRGTLSSALVRQLGNTPSHESLVREYGKLAKCLAQNELYL